MRSFIPLVRREWQLLLFAFTMTFASSFGQTFFIALFSAEIRADLALSHSSFGALYSLATLASALALLWTGKLIDHIDLQWYATMVLLGLAAGCWVLASSSSVAALFIAIFLLRHMGQGLVGLTGSTSVVRYLQGDQGKASAINGTGFSFAEAVLPSLAIAMLGVVSWRQSWLLWAGFCALLLPLWVLWLLRGHKRRHQGYLQQLNSPAADIDSMAPPGTTIRQWQRGEILRDPVFYLFLPALLAQPLLFTGFMFHQVQLVAEKGWSLPLWGSLYLLYALTALVTKLVAGLLVDRFSALRIMMWVPLPIGLALATLASGNLLAVGICFMLLLGVGVGVYTTVASPFLAELYGTLHLGAIKSLATSLMVFASAIAPVLMGALLDQGITIDQMALGALVYVGAALAMAAIGRPRAEARSHRAAPA